MGPVTATVYTWFTISTPFSHIRPQDPNKKHVALPRRFLYTQVPALIMVTAKCYLALLLACLVQVSLALPVRSSPPRLPHARTDHLIADASRACCPGPKGITPTFIPRCTACLNRCSIGPRRRSIRWDWWWPS